jgi:hypothetical protein
MVNRTERSAKSPSRRTGIFATLRALIGRKGTGAPAIGRGSRLGLLAAALTLLGVLILGVTAAGAIAPVVTAPTATSVQYTTAHFEGEVNPEDHETTYHFEYIANAAYESAGNTFTGATETPDQTLAENAGLTPVNADATGLQPETEYHLRLVATNESGTESDVAASTFTTKGPVAEPTATIDAPSLISATDGSYAFTGHVNPGGTDPAFETAWHFDCSPSCGSPQGGTISPDESSHLVEAEVTGLEPKTTYTVTLHATNAGGEASAEATFKTPAGPPLVALENTLIKPHGVVVLRGTADPRGSALTDCRFVYGTTTAYGQSTPCETESENRVHAVLSSGLVPGATYHFRLEASSVGGSAHTGDGSFEAMQAPSAGSCPNEQVRIEQQSAFLPDCRAYEQVSPVDKNGSNIVALAFRTQASTDGESLQFSSLVGFGDSHGSGVSFDYLAHRTPAGWSTHGITPTVDASTAEVRGAGGDSYYPELSADLSRGIFATAKSLAGTPKSVASAANLYLRHDLANPAAGDYRLVTACPLCEKSDPEAELEPLSFSPNILTPYLPRIAGASPDLEHVAFESIENLTEDAPAQTPFCGPDHEPPFPPPSPGSCAARLYEYDEGATRLAGILPDGTPADFSVGGLGARGLYNTPHVVSDGSDGHIRIEFTQPTNEAGETFSELDPFGQILLALPSDKSGNLFQRIDGAETIKLNESERTVGPPSPFSPAKYLDASFDGERVFFMTNQALTNDAAAPGNSQVYVYDMSKPAGNRLTLVGKEMEYFLGASKDGHYAYLSTAGQRVLLWHDGSSRDIGQRPIEASNLIRAESQWSQQFRESRVTPDGRHFLFVSDRPPVPGIYDHGTCNTGFGCHELYVYSADSDTWQCASCDPSGAPPQGSATIGSVEVPTIGRPVGNSTSGGTLGTPRQNRALSADGRYVFFNTVDALASEDTNGTVDAYEYDTRTGVISLLSSGTSDQASWFIEADPEGENVFIGTAQPLVGYDTDGAYDVYDVRARGGFPEPRPQPASCEGDSCQGSQAPLPAPAPVGSGLEGPGNRKPPRCPRGKRAVKSHGKTRCLPAKRHKKKHHHKRSNDNRRASR